MYGVQSTGAFALGTWETSELSTQYSVLATAVPPGWLCRILASNSVTSNQTSLPSWQVITRTVSSPR